MNIYTFIDRQPYTNQCKVERAADFSVAGAERQLPHNPGVTWSLQSVDKAGHLLIDEVVAYVGDTGASMGKSF